MFVRSPREQGRWVSARAVRRGVLLGAAVLGAVGSPAPAVAQAQAERWWSPQAEAINAEFLSNPALPAPENAGGEQTAVCVIDTGVGLPDGVPDDLRDAVVSRLSVFPDDQGGDDRGGVSTSEHGTAVASVIASHTPQGGPGIWRHAKIVSVRVFPGGGGAARAEDYRDAIVAHSRCASDARVRVLNLSLSEFYEDVPAVVGTDDAFLQLADAVVRVANDGVLYRDGIRRTGAVVAAVGNRSLPVADRPAYTELPESLGRFAQLPLGVSGVNTSGALCRFSNFGLGVDLGALGCGVQVTGVDGARRTVDGTSFAAPAVSAALAALRAYAPHLGTHEAEDVLVATARTTPGGSVLDVEAAFRRVGRGDLIDAYAPRVVAPAPAAAASSPASPAPATTVASCARVATVRPASRVRLLDGVIRVALTCSRPTRTLTITVVRQTRSGARVVTARRVTPAVIRRAGGVLRLVSPARWDTLRIGFRGAGTVAVSRRQLAGGDEVTLR